MKWFIFLLLISCYSLNAQEFKIVSSMPLDASKFIGIDAYNNIYSVKDNVLHKKGSEGSFVFNDFQLGNITSVDIINPLKIVLFHEDTNTVVFLDNQLNEIERINFNNLPDFINLSAATNAGNNRIWIFNVDTQQLELYNYRSNSKNTVSQPIDGKLVSQASNFNYCYLLTESKLLLFNIYGSLISETDAKGFSVIAQQGDINIGLKENSLFWYNKNSFKPLKLPISENTIKDLYLTKELLYIYDGKSILTFSITQPKQ
jgi:hypothetical protein